MKYKVKLGDYVQVRAAGTKKPAEDSENLWQIIFMDNDGNCSIRNLYDDYRARQSDRRASPQDFHASLLIGWKYRLPIQFR